MDFHDPMHHFRRALFLACLIALAACSGDWFVTSIFGSGGGSPVVPPTPNAFNEVTTAAGLRYPPPQLTIMPIGAGAACGDYDGDGWIDILVLRGRNLPTLLFRNRGNGTFEEVGAKAGLDITGNTCGPCFADIDGDGHLDLVVGGVVDTPFRMYLNLGNGTFKDITAQSKIVLSGLSCGSAFGDYDLDGDLDLFITRWERQHPTRKADEYLWRNNGDLTFTDVSVESQISKTVRVNVLQGDVTFTPNFADVNNDGWPDLLLVADFVSSRIYINKKDGTFEDTTTPNINDDNGMGGAVADYDNDGDLDWFVTSIFDDDPKKWTGNRMYRNKGDGTFEDVTTQAGVREGGWGWACSFSDFNQDGYLDIAHVNGWHADVLPFVLDPSRLYMSNGDGTFTESAEQFGFLDQGQGRGMMCLDYDNDGDLDIFVENLDQPWRLFRNDLEKGNYLIVTLRAPSPNTAAVGARVHISTGGKNQMREIHCGSNYISQDPSNAHFGLGTATVIDSLTVIWPDRTVTVKTNVAVNQRLVITK